MNIYEKKSRELIEETKRIRDEIEKKYEGQTFGLDGPATAEDIVESKRFAEELQKLKDRYPEEFKEVIEKYKDEP